jgi:2-polyprenyl-6-methoxyphenol hydroxylase-like FAD-dependent oxidoreductase
MIQSVLIVGGGIAGITLGLGLKKQWTSTRGPPAIRAPLGA